MNKKMNRWVVGGLGALLAVIVAVGAAHTTFANDQGAAAIEWRGDRGNAGGLGRGAALDTIATALTMTVADLQSALQSGQTVAALATEKGVALQTIVDALLAEQKTLLQQAVTAGRLTQAQADQQLTLLQANLPHLLSLQGGMGRHRLGSFGGRGRFGGERNLEQQPTPLPTPSQQSNDAPVVPGVEGNV